MSRGDTAERAAESLLAIVAIWLYDEKWICLTSSGQHKDMNSKRGDPGAKLAGGLAEQHQPATTCILLLSQPPWILFLPPRPPPPPWQASSASQPSPILPLLISASDLSITQPEFYVTATLWPQLQMLLSFCCRAHFLHPARATINRIFHLGPATKNDLFLAPFKI